MINADCTIDEQNAIFMLRNLDPAYHAAATDLGFAATGGTYTRTFPASTPNIALICQNFRQAASSLIRQTARLEPVPWKISLLHWLERLQGHDINWFLGGSAALAVRGFPIAPRDFDIITDAAGTHQLGNLFADVLIEPVVPVHGWMCNWFGRAFLDARFEWVGEVNERADIPDVSDFGPVAASQLEPVVWNGYTILLPPLELQLAVSRRRGLRERVTIIEHCRQWQRR